MFFIGISMLMAGIGRFAYESYSVGVDEVCAELKEKDYQESKEFRNTVLNRFYTFLDVATGNYHGDSGYSGSAVNEENIGGCNRTIHAGRRIPGCYSSGHGT